VKNVYLDLFLTFAQVGGLTFGGGYAMLPVLQRKVVEDRGWATEEELSDYYAIGQCTPGIIAVNVATFIGNKTRGIFGGVVATFGVVAPSMVIITLIAAFLQNFAHIEFVRHAFAGVRVGVCVLVLNAVVKLWKKSVKDVPGFLIFAVILALVVFLDLSPVFMVLGAGVAGVCIQGARRAVRK
jgi:chromate transporter